MKFIAIIPARYASTRFPGKPLAMLGGKPVIRRVYEQVTGVLPDARVAVTSTSCKRYILTESPAFWLAGCFSSARSCAAEQSAAAASERKILFIVKLFELMD